ncbi:hypothetical protein A4X09_0g7819 [Tilletia walkeri]|uniref:Uncharacterized protein n=1 Tax=Tilletia walkeri TaxID=117179 RepID=A0A8X7N187_9BASI|nr:hypothetical protein A4X09_0g7819 [Tilletia walkeri]
MNVPLSRCLQHGPPVRLPPPPITPINTPTNSRGLQHDLYSTPDIINNRSPEPSSSDSEGETIRTDSERYSEGGEWEPDFVDIQDHSQDDEEYFPENDDVEILVSIPFVPFTLRGVSTLVGASDGGDAAATVKAFATLLLKPTLAFVKIDTQYRFLAALAARCDCPIYTGDLDAKNTEIRDATANKSNRGHKIPRSS